MTGYAGSHTGAQIKAWLARFVARCEPDKAADRARSEREKRSVWVDHQDDGMSFLHAYLPTTDVVRIERLLTSQAKKLDSDDRRLEQKRADMLTDKLLGDAGSKSSDSSSGAVIGVLVPITSLAGVTDEPGESFDGSFAPPAGRVRDLVQEPSTVFHRIMTDPLGQVLDVTEPTTLAIRTREPSHAEHDLATWATTITYAARR